ncbi:MAG: phosphate starvation-inducible protein PhoH [Acidobacteriota bacterium]|jgi:phosphate starvation-inducible PhoH-like protein|nr:Phosphate starvation-inducible protein PhoH, predicted ATPase [Acidobacteriota bacterium]MEA2571084.1 phosphate starvation-inducible protein PhoH [Acidobacteriota bacterium]
MELTLDEQGSHVLFGNHDENLRMLEDAFDVKISSRGNEVFVQGAADRAAAVEKLLSEMQQLIEQGYPLKRSDVATGVRVLRDRPEANLVDFFTDDSIAPAVKRAVTPRNMAQKLYLQSIQDFDITFAIGPAGTGKTFLAVAVAAAALAERSVKRVILCRPAVEAGERLGFLPGDIAEKVNPYLRPLYDSLYDIIGIEKVEKMMEKNVIEIAPLAFMRGRTLNDAFIILDEAQNTTPEQMKMFLTRLGFGSKAVVTGDVTQVDLPEGKKSGLREARLILDGVEGIKFFDFNERDVVRHPLVAKIVVAYDKVDKANAAAKSAAARF